MDILFIGGTRRGYVTLKALLDSKASVRGIVSLTQDDHEIERYEEPIRLLAESHSIPHYQTKAMKDRDYARLIADDIRPDIAFVIGCRVLIPKSIYEIPPLGTLAVHDSLLPNYRGFAPLNWSIINGEKQTGVTLFYLDDRMDGGDIVGQRAVPISPGETASEVYERVCAATVDLILDAYPQLSEGRAPRTPQDYDAGSFTCSRTPADGLIDWGLPTATIYNQIRALCHPYPGAFTFYRDETLIIWKAVPADLPRKYAGRIPGRVIGISESDGHADVLTGDGILRVLEVQRKGHGKVSAATVLKSVKSALGLSSVHLLARIEILERQLNALMEAYRDQKRDTKERGS